MTWTPRHVHLLRLPILTCVQDPAFTTKACPRYCNKCLLTCYDCTTTANPTSNINCTTTECNKGELCMLRKTISGVDGYHEYLMSCANVRACDGFQSSVVNVVGRRNVKQRNVAISCCSKDLCNTPLAQTTSVPTTTASQTTSVPTTTTAQTTSVPTATTTQTTSFPKRTTAQTTSLWTRTTVQTMPVPTRTTSVTGCARDIIVMIELAALDDHQFSQMKSNLRNLLVSMVYDLQIGPNANQIKVSGFTRRIHELWSLNDYTTKDDLLDAIDYILPEFHYHLTNTIDVSELIQYIKTQDNSIHTGDRSNIPNNIIIFVDDRAQLDESLISAGWTNHELRHVTIVSIGGAAGVVSALDDLASDRHHVLHVSDYDSLYTVTQQLLALMCD